MRYFSSFFFIGCLVCEELYFIMIDYVDKGGGWEEEVCNELERM